jgi:hypothetical protein
LGQYELTEVAGWEIGDVLYVAKTYHLLARPLKLRGTTQVIVINIDDLLVYLSDKGFPQIELNLIIDIASL